MSRTPFQAIMAGNFQAPQFSLDALDVSGVSDSFKTLIQQGLTERELANKENLTAGTLLKTIADIQNQEGNLAARLKEIENTKNYHDMLAKGFTLSNTKTALDIKNMEDANALRDFEATYQQIKGVTGNNANAIRAYIDTLSPEQQRIAKYRMSADKDLFSSPLNSGITQTSPLDPGPVVPQSQADLYKYDNVINQFLATNNLEFKNGKFIEKFEDEGAVIKALADKLPEQLRKQLSTVSLDKIANRVNKFKAAVKGSTNDDVYHVLSNRPYQWGFPGFLASDPTYNKDSDDAVVGALKKRVALKNQAMPYLTRKTYLDNILRDKDGNLILIQDPAAEQAYRNKIQNAYDLDERLQKILLPFVKSDRIKTVNAQQAAASEFGQVARLLAALNGIKVE